VRRGGLAGRVGSVADTGQPAGRIGELATFGWSDRVAALVNDLDDPAGEAGRVVRVERSSAVVVFADGTERVVPTQAPPAVGDWVTVRDGLVAAIVDRWSAVTRKDPSGAGLQVLAANVDLVIVTAPADRLSPARVERELAVAWESGARPLVVLTKADLAEANAAGELRDRLAGVDVVATSALDGSGVDEVADALRPDRTAVMLGPSGAGKSSLVNALLGVERLATGEVRERDSRGRHTTTSRQLVAVPGGGVLIDTPGLRSLGLAGDGALDQVFPEIDELARGCRFGDCLHEVEPGCAVVAALAGGELETERFASYRKLRQEVAADVRRTDPVVRRQHLSVWKAQMKSAKAKGKAKRRES